MKHRRGTELDPDKLGAKHLGNAEELAWLTFDKLSEWYLLGARCSKCERAAWLDRWDLERRFSKGAYINQLAGRLRCRACGNRSGNKFLLGKMAR